MAIAMGVDSGDIAHVIAIPLQPPKQGIISIEKLIRGAEITIHQRTVKTRLMGAHRPPRRVTGTRVSPVGIPQTILVIGGPRRIRRLHHYIRLARIIPNDKDNLTRPWFPYRIP